MKAAIIYTLVVNISPIFANFILPFKNTETKNRYNRYAVQLAKAIKIYKLPSFKNLKAKGEITAKMYAGIDKYNFLSLPKQRYISYNAIVVIIATAIGSTTVSDKNKIGRSMQMDIIEVITLFNIFPLLYSAKAAVSVVE